MRLKSFKLKERFRALSETSRISFLTSSSIFIAFNGLLVTLFSFMLYEIPVDLAILSSSFLITFSAYSFNKITDTAEDRLNNPYRSEVIGRGRRIWTALSLISLFSSLVIGALHRILTIPILLIPFIAAFLYSYKVSPSIPRLKEVVGVKSLIVATSWALVGALLPTVVEIVPLSTILLVFSFIFIMIFVNTVLFDVKDVDGDIASGIKTMPAVLGMARIKKLLFSVNSLLILWLAFSLILGEFLAYLPALAFSIAYGFLLIKIFCKKNGMHLLQEFMVDGEWMPLVLLLAVTNWPP